MRITRLITLDTITQPIRDRLTGLLGALAECPWCSGFWVSVAVGASWWAWADQIWWQVAALIGSIAWLCGAGAGVGGPSQHEIAVMGAVPLINADEPHTETVETKVETTIHLPEDMLIDDLAAAVARHLQRAQGRTDADDGADGAY